MFGNVVNFIGGVEEQLSGLLPFLDFYLHVYKVGGYFSPHGKDGLHEKEIQIVNVSL